MMKRKKYKRINKGAKFFYHDEEWLFMQTDKQKRPNQWLHKLYQGFAILIGPRHQCEHYKKFLEGHILEWCDNEIGRIK